MTETQKRCYSALNLLAVLYLSTAVLLGQSTMDFGSPAIASPHLRELPRTEIIDSVQIPINPFAVLPASDALIVLDVKRLISEVLPRLLSGEQDTRSLVIALTEPKTVELLDPRAIQRLVVGFRYSNPQDEQSPSDFEVLTVAQSS